MAVRTINYTVTANGITPATQQLGGVQGEHNATELVFALDADLLETIRGKAGENPVVYRFDVHDGAGGVTPTDPQPLTDEAPVYLLENKISRIGGSIQVFLIITEIENEQTEMDLFSFPALLRLKDKQDGPLNEGENYESLSTLSETAKQSAADAAESAQASEASATAAYHSQLQTEAARLALEGGAEVVFLGGRHAANIEIIATVDNEMSEASHNPVQNKVVLERIKQTDQSVNENAEAIAALEVNTEEAHLFMAMHPVGSLYWSGQNVNPAETYGGEWELVDKEFKPLSYVNNNYTDITDGLVIQPSDKEFASTVYQVQCVRNGHQATLQVAFTTTKEITADKNADLFVVNFDEIGARRIIYYWRNTIAFSDNLNYQNGVYCDVYYSDGSDNNMGVVYTTETIRAEKISSGTGLIIRLDFQFEPFCIDADGNRVDVMLDSACDKFCWKRLA